MVAEWCVDLYPRMGKVDLFLLRYMPNALRISVRTMRAKTPPSLLISRIAASCVALSIFPNIVAIACFFEMLIFVLAIWENLGKWPPLSKPSSVHPQHGIDDLYQPPAPRLGTTR